jgi:hypothetical protein
MYVGSELEVSSFYIIEHFYLWCIPLLHHYLTDIVVIITLDTCRYLRMQSGQSSLSTIFFYCPRTIPCIFRAIFHFSVTFLDIHRLQVIEHFLPTYYYWDRKVGNITILDYYFFLFIHTFNYLYLYYQCLFLLSQACQNISLFLLHFNFSKPVWLWLIKLTATIWFKYCVKHP